MSHTAGQGVKSDKTDEATLHWANLHGSTIKYLPDLTTFYVVERGNRYATSRVRSRPLQYVTVKVLW